MSVRRHCNTDQRGNKVNTSVTEMFHCSASYWSKINSAVALENASSMIIPLGVSQMEVTFNPTISGPICISGLVDGVAGQVEIHFATTGPVGAGSHWIMT